MQKKSTKLIWVLIPAIIFYGLYFTIGGDLWGTLGLLFGLIFIALLLIRGIKKIRINEQVKNYFSQTLRFIKASYPSFLKKLLIVVFLICLFLVAKGWLEVRQIKIIDYQTNPSLYWGLWEQREAKQDVLNNYLLLTLAILGIVVAVPIARFLWLKSNLDKMPSFQKYTVILLVAILIVLIAMVIF